MERAMGIARPALMRASTYCCRSDHHHRYAEVLVSYFSPNPLNFPEPDAEVFVLGFP